MPAPESRPADPAAYDEMVTGDGTIRRHWRDLAGVLAGLSDGALADRAARARAHLASLGVVGDVAGQPVEERRPWDIDLVPVILTAGEWRAIEAGLIERAGVLDALLADLYGARRLAAAGAVPPAVLYANPEFLRACRRPAAAASDRRMLRFYAADLIRGEDGGWRVLADHTQAPAGLGYALMNRRVVGRFLSEGIRASRVRPVLPFVDFVQAALTDWAPHEAENPRAVLLTPGPFAAGYFEHTLLAKELGIALVEGADLTVRDGAVYLKTLGGLQRVDVLLRRQDAAFCDPLDLYPWSLLGAVGLVEAERAGRVVIANALGSALVEAPAMRAWLPHAARRILGRDLALPMVETLWLGDPDARARVAAAGDGHIVVSGYDARRGAHPPTPEQVAARPERFAAVAGTAPSWTPTLVDGRLEPRPFVLRVFLVALGDRYVAMPGGIARLPLDMPETPPALLQFAGTSKDVWVQAEDEDEITTPARSARATVVDRPQSGELQSRVAENLYWMGRHVERMEFGARLLRATLTRQMAAPLDAREMLELRTCARLLGRLEYVDPEGVEAPVAGVAFARTLAGICRPRGQLHTSFREVERLSVTVRDRFSFDMWRTIGTSLATAFGGMAAAGRDLEALLAACEDLVMAGAAVSGVAAENMVRGAPWRVFDLGRRVERAACSAGALATVFSLPASNWEVALLLALELADSVITYRTRYLAALQTGPVTDVVLLDTANPRSLGYQYRAIADHLGALPPPAGAVGGPQESVGRLRAMVEAAAGSGTPVTLAAELDALQSETYVLSERLVGAYFTLVARPRPMSGSLLP